MAEENSEYLNLKVKSQVPTKINKDGDEVFFKIKRTT